MMKVLLLMAVLVQAVLLIVQHRQSAKLRAIIVRQNAAMQNLIRADQELKAADDGLMAEHAQLKLATDRLLRARGRVAK